MYLVNAKIQSQTQTIKSKTSALLKTLFYCGKIS